MVDPLPLDTATLAGLFAGSVLYGIFVVLVFGALYVLIYKRTTAQPNWTLILSAVAMFILNTAVIVISYSRVNDAFVLYRDAPGGPLADLMQLSQWKEVARTAIMTVYLALADGILVYRCWIVWDKRFLVIAFPCVLWLANSVVDCFMVVAMSRLRTGDTIFIVALSNWLLAVLCLTLAENIIVTSLIVYRIWKINVVSGGGNLKPAISLILESGIIYVTTLFIFLMTYIANSNSQYIMVDCVDPMTGITFSLLIVRVGLRRTQAPAQSHPSNRTVSTRNQIRPISLSTFAQRSPSVWQTAFESLSHIEEESQDDLKEGERVQFSQEQDISEEAM